MRQTLDCYLNDCASPDVASTVATIAGGCAHLSRRIARSSSLGSMAATVGRNAGGDSQKALDVIADEIFAKAIALSPVRFLASEERETVATVDPSGALAVALDPLDGSSNIAVNVSIGTIFSIRAAGADGLGSFLRPGREQLAAGYAIYGPQTMLVLSVGTGVAAFVLDPESEEFLTIATDLRVPTGVAEYAVNASNRRRWADPVRAFVDDCVAGAAGPFGCDFNMRWVASLVAEAHRILMRGGVFLYPGDSREGYARGRLRMLYECAPIAMLLEQAGGAATDGLYPILDQRPDTLHARTPFVFGSADRVANVTAYHGLPEREASPLFGQRGLFTARGAR
jgi:fructose-1,6-bisphosphatase I